MSSPSASSSTTSTFRESLLNAFKHGEQSASEQTKTALEQLIRELHKILPVKDHKKGLFGKTVLTSCFTAQSFIEMICKVLLEGSSTDEKLADFIGSLMIRLKMIEFIDGQKNSATQPSLSTEKKSLVHFLHPYMPRLVIIGAGHAGLLSAGALKDYFSIVLIDKNEYGGLKPGYPVILEKVEHAQKISVKYSEIVPSNVTFIQGLTKLVREDGIFIDMINQEKQSDIFSNNSESDDELKRCKYLTFDYLVISTGCTAWRNLPTYDASNGDNEITYVDSYNFNMVKNSVQVIKDSDDSKSIVVIGGGLVGVEYFGSLCDTYPKKQVYLVQRSEMLMRPSKDAHKAAIDTYSKVKNAHVMLNSTIVRQSDPHTLVIKSKDNDTEQSVNCCVCYLASGCVPNTSFMQANFSSSMEESGFLKVNTSFQLLKSGTQYYTNIFALGDVNNSDVEKLVQNANFHADKFIEIAKKVVQLQSNLPIYETGARVMAVSLGPKTGFVYKDNKVMFKSGIVNKLKTFLQTSTIKNYNNLDK